MDVGTATFDDGVAMEECTPSPTAQHANDLADNDSVLEYLVTKVERTLAASSEALVALKSVLDGCQSDVQDIREILNDTRTKNGEKDLEIEASLLEQTQELHTMRADLSRREAEIIEKEKAAAQRVQKLKDEAMAAITAEQRRVHADRNLYAPVAESKIPNNSTSADVAVVPTESRLTNGCKSGTLEIVTKIISSHTSASLPTTPACTKDMELDSSLPQSVRTPQDSANEDLGSDQQRSCAERNAVVAVDNDRHGASKLKIPLKISMANPTQTSRKEVSREVSREGSEDVSKKIPGEVPKEASKKVSILKETVKTGDGEALLLLIASRSSQNHPSLVNAMALSPDPAALLLSGLHKVLPTLHHPSLVEVDHQNRGVEEADIAIRERRRIIKACEAVFDAVHAVLEKPEMMTKQESILSEKMKADSSALALCWLASIPKPITAENSIEAHLVLQLLSLFGVKDSLEKEDLFSLCAAWGGMGYNNVRLIKKLELEERVPDLIENLFQQKEYLVTFYLCGHFDYKPKAPFSTLFEDWMVYERRVRREANPDMPKFKELGNESYVLRMVIRFIKILKLEKEVPLQPLVAKAKEMEKGRAEIKDKKRLEREALERKCPVDFTQHPLGKRQKLDS